jgi:hypothetical protein
MSNPTEAPGAEQSAPSANLIAGRSKVVHAPSPILSMEPLCSAGRKRNSRTYYLKTTAPVTCKNCGPDSAVTPAPVVSTAEVSVPEFPPGLRLFSPQTGAGFEVLEHTHAVRLINLRTGGVSAIPQEMARKFIRVDPATAVDDRFRLGPSSAALSALAREEFRKGMHSTPIHRDLVRAGFHARQAELFDQALSVGMAALVRTAEAFQPMLLGFARNARRATAALGAVFGVPHPNACGLCGSGEGERDHLSGHVYQPPTDPMRLSRMQARREMGAPARQRIHTAHIRYRRAVNLRILLERLKREAPHWTAPPTELDRAGLTEVPFDQQRVQPDASAFSLPS